MIDMIKKTLQELIAIDTTSSGGCETNAALYLKRLCDEYGIYSEVIEGISGKGNLVSYLPGKDPLLPNILLHAHLDTADIGDITRWKYPPHSGVEIQGSIYGRGALDCKGLVSLWICMMIYFKKNNIKLRRGIVFAATADEENGGSYGTAWLLQNNRLVSDCKFVIGEGGGFSLSAGGKSYVVCQTGERGRIKYKANSFDFDGIKQANRDFGNSILILGRGLIKEKALNLTSIGYIMRSKVKEAKRIASKSFCKNTLSIEDRDGDGKIIEASFLYSTCEHDIRKKVAKLIEIDEQQLEPIEVIEPQYSICSTGLWKYIQEELKKLKPGTALLPFISPGYSDNRLFRQNGMLVYGFFPIGINDDLNGIHGYNERIRIDSLYFAFELLLKVLNKFCNMKGWI